MSKLRVVTTNIRWKIHAPSYLQKTWTKLSPSDTGTKPSLERDTLWIKIIWLIIEHTPQVTGLRKTSGFFPMNTVKWWHRSRKIFLWAFLKQLGFVSLVLTSPDYIRSIARGDSTVESYARKVKIKLQDSVQSYVHGVWWWWKL